MVNVILLCSIIVGVSAQSIIKKYYNNKSDDKGVFIFSAMSVLAACVFFVFSSGFKLHFTPEVLPYALGFAASFGTATVMGFLAIRSGSLSLTSLVTSYSLIIPSFYGIIFLHESASVWLWIGLALLAVSLFLINSKQGEVKITLKWVIFALLAFIGNGVCSTVQTVQQKTFDGQYKSELMIIALVIVAAVLFGIAFFSERDEIKPCLKCGTHWMLLCGLANGAVNLFVMLLSVRMNASLMFPLISAGGIVLTWVVSRFFYKEKLTVKQNLALVFGIVSVVFMNL